ncbi:MAG: choice-of-anchor Q domain-containing protein [Thermoanaerobaculia bacterium]
MRSGALLLPRIGVACLVILVTSGPSLAATFTVNSTADAVDSNPGNGVCATAGGFCTLRAAITEANTLGGGPHTITVPAGTYILAIVGTGEDNNLTGDLDILQGMTINGAGADVTIIDANGIDRVFDIRSNSPVTISNLTARNGNPGAGNDYGGIFNGNAKPLTLNNVTVSGCTARDGAGIANNSGNITLTNVTVSGNTATRNGGGIFTNSGSVALTNVTVSGNSASGLGGGIYNQSGNANTLTNVTIANNSAGTGGGIYKNSGSISLKNTIVANSTSGGNCSGTITSAGNNIDSANTCAFAGTGDKINTNPLLGALANNGGPTQTQALLAGSPAIDAGTGAGAPAVDQRGVSRPQGAGYDIGAYEYQPPDLCPGYVVTTTADNVSGSLRQCIIKANSNPGATLSVPAGTYTLTIAGRGETAGATGDLNINANMTINGAGAASTIVDGGGLDRVFHVDKNATASISGLTVRNGSAGAPDSQLEGGGILSEGVTALTDVALTGNTTSSGGGGVYNKKGTLTLNRCTISGNNAVNGGGIGGESGGLTIINVTVSGNTASALGGGVYNKKSLITTMTNVTITGNSAATAGGIYWGDGASNTMVNTIVANSPTGGNCSGVAESASSSNNLDSGNTCGFIRTGDKINTNPLLGALANNGGPTQTQALLAGSPAIDAGTGVGAPAVDQRGVSRPQGAGYDIGAYEYTPLISGNVFEDVNYGGGAGRTKAASLGVSCGSARVELYTSGGVYSTFTTTDGSGNYSFNLVAGTYYVRVVNSLVTSSRAGCAGSAVAVQTYRTDATSGAAVPVTDYVGGTDPSVVDPGNGSTGATFNTTTFVYSAVLTGTAQSVTKAVVSSAGITGLDFGFNFDTIVNTNDANQGSLRQFITNANLLSNAGLTQAGRTAGIDNAIWMISNGTAGSGLRSANNYFSGGVATVAPASPLPAIADPAILDAQTQPGWSGVPIVQLTGTGAGAGARGLDLEAGGSTVRGFVINGFTGNANSAGVWIGAGNGSTIQGNYIGTNAAGSASAANYQGMYINTSSNTIGGSSSSQRNVVSGNTWRGILVDSGGGSNVIRGNYVGTNAAGSAPLANSIGIYLSESPNNVVGGTGAGEGNVASGNTNYGIYLVYPGASGNLVQGNTVGLNASRSGTVPNGSSGIEFCCIAPNGAGGNTIGGTAAAAANVISGNGGGGVVVRGGTGNAILGDSIYANGVLGIDLGADGVTLNDGLKPAGQPNLGMDFPVFTSAVLSGTTLTVAGYVGNAPGQSLFASTRVEIFKSDNDATGYGEGQTYLGFLTTDPANGNFSGSLSVSGLLAAGDKITGTATDGANNTSEFGANVVPGSLLYFKKREIEYP